MKNIRRLFWAILVLAFAGCDPAPQGATSAQANPPNQNSRPGDSPSIKINYSWFGNTDTPGKLDAVLTRKNYYVVLDGSGSMAGRQGGEVKLVAAKAAIKIFASSVPQDANLGLLAFDGQGISERVSLGVNNRPAFNRKLDEVDDRSGTPLKSAITAAYDRIREQARRQLGYGEYHLVIVTDGEADFGEDPRGIVDRMLGESPIIIHTIGFGIGEGHSLNQKGRTIYRTADDRAGLQKGLAEILAESDRFN